MTKPTPRVRERPSATNTTNEAKREEDSSIAPARRDCAARTRAGSFVDRRARPLIAGCRRLITIVRARLECRAVIVAVSSPHTRPTRRALRCRVVTAVVTSHAPRALTPWPSPRIPPTRRVLSRHRPLLTHHPRAARYDAASSPPLSPLTRRAPSHPGPLLAYHPRAACSHAIALSSHTTHAPRALAPPPFPLTRLALSHALSRPLAHTFAHLRTPSHTSARK